MRHATLFASVAVVAAAVTAALVPVSMWIARRLGVLDQPGHRKIHAEPTPRLGGIAVFCGFLGVVLGGLALMPLFGQPPLSTLFGGALAPLQEAYRVQGKLLAIVAGGVIVFAVGLLDDVLGERFPVGVKAGGQVLAALVLVAGQVGVTFLPWEPLNVAVTLVWVVGITNAFNLLDNMDGLSAGVAMVAAAVLMMNAWSMGEIFISLLLAAFIGSLVGFLFFNFNPARVFLGDCGSLFIGYAMASAMLLERYVTHAESSLFAVLMPVLVLAVPIMDTTTVVVIRLREGRPVYVGDANHLSHRLVQMGLSRRGAVLVLYLATLCLGIGAKFLPEATPFEIALILLQAGGIVALLLALMYMRREPEVSA